MDNGTNPRASKRTRTARPQAGDAAADVAVTPAAHRRFERLSSPRAFEAVATQIRATLEKGGVQPGTRLPTERDLAGQMGVSRNTLREALRSLENSGLVRMQKGPNGGIFIAQPTGDAVLTSVADMYRAGSISSQQLTQARIWLSGILVHEACARATAADIALLNANIDTTEAALRANDFEARVTGNMNFHRLLAQIAGNPLIATFMESVLAVLKDFILSLGDKRHEFVIASRRRFMTLFAARDAHGAEEEMRLMLVRTEAEYFSQLPAITRRAATK